MNKFLRFDGKVVKELKPEENILEQLQKEVGGFIEHVKIPDLAPLHIEAWINEEGKILGLKPAMIFQSIVMQDGEWAQYTDTLNGPIIFARYDKEGEILPLRRQDLDYLKTYLEEKMADIFFDEEQYTLPLIHL